MSRAVVAVAGVGMALALVLAGVPWATKERTSFTGTPTPPAFSTVTPLVLAPGSQACQAGVALDDLTKLVVVQTGKRTVRGPALTVRVTGPGYAATGRIPAGYGPLEAVGAAIPAPRRSLLARVCVGNDGPGRAALQASTERRVNPRPMTVVDGRPVAQKMTLLLTEGAGRSIASRKGEVLDHVSAFKPWWVGRGSLAVLALLAVVGVPLLVLRALAGAEDR